MKILDPGYVTVSDITSANDMNSHYAYNIPVKSQTIMFNLIATDDV